MFEPYLVIVDPGELPLRYLPFPLLQEPLSLGFFIALGGFIVGLPIPIIFDPPNVSPLINTPMLFNFLFFLLFLKISGPLRRGDWQNKWTDGIKVGEITG
jgi:hypothetical protein